MTSHKEDSNILTLRRSRLSKADPDLFPVYTFLYASSMVFGCGRSNLVGTEPFTKSLLAFSPIDFFRSYEGSKQSASKCSEHTTVSLEGPFQFFRVEITAFIHISRTSCSVGKWCRLISSVFLFEHPPTTHIRTIFSFNPNQSYLFTYT